MQRTPEPELMEGAAQAAAYAAADFAVAHQRIVDDLLARFPELSAPADPQRVLDLGCGPADVLVRLARALPTAEFVGVDGSSAMLAEGHRRLEGEQLSGRVVLRELLLPVDPAVLAGRWSLVTSNSLLHHLHEPQVLWSTVAATAAPGTVVFVADLARPDSSAAVDAIVAAEATGEPEVLVEDFRASLHAAFRPDEVRHQLGVAGLGDWLEVSLLDDHHLVVAGRCP
ncbi:MAG: class I SAM-dependent methyltransferase [Acidimicrobiia bacterium]|nr:class I SAM-dependent methyltransferase [Acidimicrobiia bacterium]